MQWSPGRLCKSPRLCKQKIILGQHQAQPKARAPAEIDAEIRNQAVRLYPRCTALFELPNMVYWQIMQDNTLRHKPYRVSEERCKKIILAMPEFD